MGELEGVIGSGCEVLTLDRVKKAEDWCCVTVRGKISR